MHYPQQGFLGIKPFLRVCYYPSAESHVGRWVTARDETHRSNNAGVVPGREELIIHESTAAHGTQITEPEKMLVLVRQARVGMEDVVRQNA